MEQSDCPKWMECTAPVCPLDPNWKKRTMHNSEPTCQFLTEAVKPDAKARFEHYGYAKMWPIVVSGTAQMMKDKHAKIKLTCEKAAQTASKWDTAEKNRQNMLEYWAKKETE